MTIQKLEKRVLSELGVFHRKELFSFLGVDASRHPLEEKSFRLFLIQPPKLIQLFRAVVYLPLDTEPVREDKVHLHGIFHDYFDQVLELVPVIGRHNALAVVHNDQHMLIGQLLYNPLGVFLELFVKLYLHVIEKLKNQGLHDFFDALAVSDIDVDDPIPEKVPELDVSDHLPNQSALTDACIADDSDEPPFALQKLQNFMKVFGSRDEILDSTGQVPRVLCLWGQICEIGSSKNVQRRTLLLRMVFQEDELLDFMDSELAC